MPAYVVDSSKQPMVATGVVDARFDWVETPGGGRAQSDVQTRDDATGMPVWGVEVMYQQVQYGRTSSVIASVTLPAYDRPDVTALGPIGFENLRVEVRVTRTPAAWSSTGPPTPSPPRCRARPADPLRAAARPARRPLRRRDMAAGLTSTGSSGTGGVAPGRVDVVVWARALGVRNADEVWEHVIKTSADIGRVMDDLSAVVQRATTRTTSCGRTCCGRSG